MLRDQAGEAKKGMPLGKYELGRTLGEGNFGKVKYARHLDSGQSFAVKILDKARILDIKFVDQIKREIGTLKLLKHPNVVRLHEVIASKSKIYMVLEYVTGGELFDKIASKGRLGEAEGRKLFQQLIDAVSYCHDKGVYHRDLKPENVLVDAVGNIKISDFGLSALPQHFRDDGLLHTTCGSPNYVAPEVLANRGYDGATSDIWSCGVILYVILAGCLPFEDRNLAVLYQKIFRGKTQIPKWLSSGAQNIIRKILDPNPKTRLSIADIKADEWFNQSYIPARPYEEDDKFLYEEPISVGMSDVLGDVPTLINAFQLIGMSSGLDLSGFFEEEHASERKIMFTSNHALKDLLEKIKDTVTKMGFSIKKINGKLKVTQQRQHQTASASLLVSAEVLELSSSLYVVELKKSQGDLLLYRQVCFTFNSIPNTQDYEVHMLVNAIEGDDIGLEFQFHIHMSDQFLLSLSRRPLTRRVLLSSSYVRRY